MSRAILYDATLCIGCKQCEDACARENGLTYDEKIAAEETTSDHKYTTVRTVRGDKFMRTLCMHCQEPTCASVCPVAALYKSKDGPVLYRADRCMGCRYCMVACPFDIPKYEWSRALPIVRKCILCPERGKKGLPTACSEICPAQATITGDRDELIREAHRRIEANPGQYVNHVFGETEVGGTSVLMLSSIPFDQCGFKSHYESEAMPELTYRVLKRIPDFVPLGFVLLGGVWWITNRRMELAAGSHRTQEPDNNVRDDELKGGRS